MFRNIFSVVDGITILPIIAMIIFIVMFILIVYYVIRLDKKTEKNWSEMPLDENNNSKINV
jgi:hypothetical protein